MRLSILPGDPGYHKDAGLYDVYFRGVLRRDVITADEEDKMILHYVLGDDGRPIRHPANPSRVRTEVSWGEVVIVRRRQLPR